MDSLFYLALIWAAIFVASVMARKTRLTPVLWFLTAGAIMVNTGILPVETDPFIGGLSELGIILIMFALGFEESTKNFIGSIKKSWGIAFFGALAPFLTAYFVADWFWDDTNIAILCGLTMTATAVSLTMVALKSEGLGQSQVATRIMTSAVLDDIAALALVAILVPIASGDGSINLPDIIIIVAKAVLFFVLVSLLGAWFFPHEVTGWIKRIPLIRTYGIRHLIAFGQHSTLTVLLLALVVGLIAHAFGFHPAIGAYMAGLIIRDEYFAIKGDHGSYEDTRRIVDNVAFTWIGPVFFITLGTRIVFDLDIMITIIPQTIILVIGIFFTQVGSAAFAARYTGGMNWPGSVMIGFGMLGRAELAFVVMDIAYVQNNILDTEAFYMLMATAFILNILVSVAIPLWKPYYVRSLRSKDR